MANALGPQKVRQLKNIDVIFDAGAAGATNFANVVQSFQFTPQVTTSSTQGGKPGAVFTDVTVTGWTCAVKYLQDPETLGSLTDYLVSNAGTTKRVDFIPYGGTGWTANVILPAPPIGGDINAWLADTITMGVSGAPSRVADDPTTPVQP